MLYMIIFKNKPRSRLTDDSLRENEGVDDSPDVPTLYAKINLLICRYFANGPYIFHCYGK